MLAAAGLDGPRSWAPHHRAASGDHRREGRDQRGDGGLPARVHAGGGGGGRRASARPALRLSRPGHAAPAAPRWRLIVNGPDRAAARHQLRRQRVRPGLPAPTPPSAARCASSCERDRHAPGPARPRHARPSRQVHLLHRGERGGAPVGAAARRARGLRREDSAVTLIAVATASTRSTTSWPRSRSRCSTASPTRSATWARPNLLGFNETLVVFAGEHMRRSLQKAGWSRHRRAALPDRAHATDTVADYKRGGAPARRGHAGGRDHAGATASSGPEDILIAFAGGRAGSWSACLPGLGNQVDPQRDHAHRRRSAGGTA